MIRISFKKAPILIGAFLFFFSTTFLIAQAQFNKVFDLHSLGKGLVQSNDSIFLMSFQGNLITNLNLNFSLLTDQGNQINNKSYYGLSIGAYPTNGGKLKLKNEVFYAMSTFNDSLGYVGSIQLLNKELDSLTRFYYRRESYSTILDQCVVNDDSTVVAIGGANDSLSTAFVIKFDKTGQVLWELLLPELYSYKTLDFTEQILATSDGNYLVSGKLEITEPFSNLNRSDPFLYKVAPDGTLLWGKRYGGIGSDSQGYVQELNGHYYFTYSEQVGNAPQSGGNIPDLQQVFMKLDTSGNVIFKKIIAPMFDTRHTYNFLKTTDDDFIVVSIIGERSVYLNKVNANGDSLFQKLLYYSSPYCNCSNYVYDLAELSDGSLVGTGWFVGQPLDSSMAYGGYTWLFKTDSEGCLVPNCGDISNIPSAIESIGNQAQLALRLGPNPARDVLYVAIASAQDQLPSSPQLRIINLQGQVVHEDKLPPIGNLQAIVPVQHLPRGLYIVELVDNHANWRLTQKVVLK